jgi:SAM-dependent methyltransferase
MNTSDAWYGQWFDTPYYHMLYNNRDESEAASTAAALSRHLALPYGTRILDAACGAGRHARALHALGYQVTGIDLSEQSIQRALIHAAPGLEFFVHDIRNDFRINFYDVVCNLFTSFGYFSGEHENLRVLNVFFHSLVPGGTLLIDFLNPHHVIETLVPTGSKSCDGVEFRWTKKVTPHHIIKEITVNDGDKEFHFAERVQLIGRETFTEYLQRSGFVEVSFYGGTDFSPFHSERSPRQVIVARKPKA